MLSNEQLLSTSPQMNPENKKALQELLSKILKMFVINLKLTEQYASKHTHWTIRSGKFINFMEFPQKDKAKQKIVMSFQDKRNSQCIYSQFARQLIDILQQKNRINENNYTSIKEALALIQPRMYLLQVDFISLPSREKVQETIASMFNYSTQRQNQFFLIRMKQIYFVVKQHISSEQGESYFIMNEMGIEQYSIIYLHQLLQMIMEPHKHQNSHIQEEDIVLSKLKKLCYCSLSFVIISINEIPEVAKDQIIAMFQSIQTWHHLKEDSSIVMSKQSLEYFQILTNQNLESEAFSSYLMRRYIKDQLFQKVLKDFQRVQQLKKRQFIIFLQIISRKKALIKQNILLIQEKRKQTTIKNCLRQIFQKTVDQNENTIQKNQKILLEQQYLLCALLLKDRIRITNIVFLEFSSSKYDFITLLQGLIEQNEISTKPDEILIILITYNQQLVLFLTEKKQFYHSEKGFLTKYELYKELQDGSKQGQKLFEICQQSENYPYDQPSNDSSHHCKRKIALNNLVTLKVYCSQDFSRYFMDQIVSIFPEEIGKIQISKISQSKIKLNQTTVTQDYLQHNIFYKYNLQKTAKNIHKQFLEKIRRNSVHKLSVISLQSKKGTQNQVVSIFIACIIKFSWIYKNYLLVCRLFQTDQKNRRVTFNGEDFLQNIKSQIKKNNPLINWQDVLSSMYTKDIPIDQDLKRNFPRVISSLREKLQIQTYQVWVQFMRYPPTNYIFQFLKEVEKYFFKNNIPRRQLLTFMLIEDKIIGIYYNNDNKVFTLDQQQFGLLKELDYANFYHQSEKSLNLLFVHLQPKNFKSRFSRITGQQNNLKKIFENIFQQMNRRPIKGKIEDNQVVISSQDQVCYTICKKIKTCSSEGENQDGFEKFKQQIKFNELIAWAGEQAKQNNFHLYKPLIQRGDDYGQQSCAINTVFNSILRILPQMLRTIYFPLLENDKTFNFKYFLRKIENIKDQSKLYFQNPIEQEQIIFQYQRKYQQISIHQIFIQQYKNIPKDWKIQQIWNHIFKHGLLFLINKVQMRDRWGYQPNLIMELFFGPNQQCLSTVYQVIPFKINNQYAHKWIFSFFVKYFSQLIQQKFPDCAHFFTMGFQQHQRMLINQNQIHLPQKQQKQKISFKDIQEKILSFKLNDCYFNNSQNQIELTFCIIKDGQIKINIRKQLQQYSKQFESSCKNRNVQVISRLRQFITQFRYELQPRYHHEKFILKNKGSHL